MNESQLAQEDKDILSLSRHSFGLMIILAILITSGLVVVSMALYYSSGAAQLDLSRPGYNDVRDQIEKNDDFGDYSSTGAINAGVVTEFKLLFSERLKKIESVDSFGGDPLSSDALGMAIDTTQ